MKKVYDPGQKRKASTSQELWRAFLADLLTGRIKATDLVESRDKAGRIQLEYVELGTVDRSASRG